MCRQLGTAEMRSQCQKGERERPSHHDISYSVECLRSYVSLGYYCADMDRLFDPTYVPSEQDIARTRAQTVGISETVFRMGRDEITVIDVEGQKSERRKWIHCFQDVTAILFVVNLNGYDQCLVEDKDTVGCR